MTVYTGLVITAIVLLGIITYLRVFVLDKRRQERFSGLERVSTSTAKLVRALMVRHADEDVQFRGALVKALSDSKMICADCPLRNSQMCQECGRYASGEGRNPAP